MAGHGVPFAERYDAPMELKTNWIVAFVALASILAGCALYSRDSLLGVALIAIGCIVAIRIFSVRESDA